MPCNEWGAPRWLIFHCLDLQCSTQELIEFWVTWKLSLEIQYKSKLKSWFSLILTLWILTFSVVNCIELFKNYGWKFYKHLNYKNILIIPPYTPTPPTPSKHNIKNLLCSNSFHIFCFKVPYRIDFFKPKTSKYMQWFFSIKNLATSCMRIIPMMTIHVNWFR